MTINVSQKMAVSMSRDSAPILALIHGTLETFLAENCFNKFFINICCSENAAIKVL